MNLRRFYTPKYLYVALSEIKEGMSIKAKARKDIDGDAENKVPGPGWNYYMDSLKGTQLEGTVGKNLARNGYRVGYLGIRCYDKRADFSFIWKIDWLENIELTP